MSSIPPFGRNLDEAACRPVEGQTPTGTRTPGASTSGILASPSSGGKPPVQVGRSWANIVSKDPALLGRHASSGSGSTPSCSKRNGSRLYTIVDYLLFLAQEEQARREGNGGYVPAELPPELERFRGGANRAFAEKGAENGPARYWRRGMRNDANNCYVNVVIQSLLPCSSLMQLLSHCSHEDEDRPFYASMVRLGKEFHSRRHKPEAFNVLQFQQVKDIISAWQSLGVQQDAGEFLFHMLNGMHEECKWQALPAEPSTPSTSSTADPAAAGAPGEAGATGRGAVEVRSIGVHEDSPIMRIFGGTIESSLRSTVSKADSVSVEPFNHLILDISSPDVDSVVSALKAHCRPEAVDEGRSTKQLQFRSLPKALILTLKRFSYNKDTGCSQKIKKPITYEEQLVFDPAWLVDGVPSQEYQLSAIICHHGDSVNGGHYTAVARHRNAWFLYDDANIRHMDHREVVSQMYEAYIFIYQSNENVRIRP